MKVVGEFWWAWLAVENHLWRPGANNWVTVACPSRSKNGKLATKLRLIFWLALTSGRDCAAGVYTQTTDVEGEINGLLTYDRIRKADPAWLREQSEFLLSAPTSLKNKTTLLPTL